MKHLTLKLTAFTLIMAASLPAHSAVWRTLNTHLQGAANFHETSPLPQPIQDANWLAPETEADPQPDGRDALGEFLESDPRAEWNKALS